MAALSLRTAVWHAVDGAGRDLATGRPPAGPGSPTPAAALAAAPVPAWPVGAVDGAGRSLDLATALGAGGPQVARLAAALAGPRDADRPASARVAAMARSTPGGGFDGPVDLVPPAAAVAAAGGVDAAWLAVVDHRRRQARDSVVAAGRGAELDAALNVVMLLATERLDPAGDDDVDAHVVSGGQLWILGGAVAAALAGDDPDPFAAWGGLVAAGYWPVGPVGGRLVVGAPA